jgi:ATP-dependent helicase/nuclease subunit A
LSSSLAAFSDEQLSAIALRDTALALAANAGSGKTSVLVERFVRSVVEDGVAPGQILAITFTERAAAELRRRVRERLVDEQRRDGAGEAAAAFISTFHGFAVRLLRSHPLLAGLAPGFTVLDDGETAALRERAFQLALASWLERDGALDLAATFGTDSLQSSIVGVYEERRSHGELAPRLPEPTVRFGLTAIRQRLAAARERVATELGEAARTASIEQSLDRLERCRELLASGAATTPAAIAGVALVRRGAAFETATVEAYETARSDFEDALADELAIAAVPLLDALLLEFGERFTALKAAHGSADFDDLELHALALLRDHADVARAWRERFERVMVDELQDTNPRQMELLALLDAGNLFTVGDAFQSIYAFRHADVAIFRGRFSALAAAGKALVLSANYRSRDSILDAVNAVFTPRFDSSFVALRAGRDDAAGGAPLELLLTDCDGWEEHEELLGRELAPAPLWRRAEARLLAARIDEIVQAGEADPSEIVVLTRAASAVDVYETAIRDRGYATLRSAGDGFYERSEVADITAYVQALANPLDELALYGVLASPLCGADSDALVALANLAREPDTTVWGALGRTADPRLLAFSERFAQARDATHRRSLGAVITAAIRDHGYDGYLAQLPSPERRIANVRKLARLAREFEHREGRDLRRFADALSAGRLGALREPEAPPPVGDAIRLMTIHRAKGLEFPVVAIADLGHGPNASQQRLLTDGERVGLRLPNIERTHHDTLDFAELRDERRAAEAAEEQRIYYVAMTRARERLILSGAARFASWPANEASAISWLAPALVPDLADRLEGGGAAPEVVPGAAGLPVALTLCDPARAGRLLAGPRPTAEAEPAEPLAVGPSSPSLRPPASELRHSYTALADYERCGYRYYLQRVLSLADVDPPPPTAAGIAAAPRGILVHQLLEQLDFADPRPPDPARVAAAAAGAGIALTPADSAGIASLAGAFGQSPLCARLAAARGVRREEPFAFVLDGELVRGVIDVCASGVDGTLLIVDYKTDMLNEGEELAARIDRDYGLQRLIYALAGLYSGAARVEVAYCFLRAPLEPLTSAYLGAARAALEAALRERLEPLRSGRFEVTALPGRERCSTCPGRSRLCSYDESLTLRDTFPAESSARASGNR